MSNILTKKKQIIEESVESKPRNRYVEPITVKDEAKNLWEGMLNSTRQDIIGGTASSLSEQIFGFDSSENQLTEGQAVQLSKAKVEDLAEDIKVSAEHMEYFRTVQNADRIGETRTEAQIRQAVEEIRMEIRKLIQTSRIVEQTVKDATVEKAPIKPGKYHVTFFEFVLGVIKDATRKLEDAVSFGAIFASKKQQKQYWSLYKSKGTMFGLSGERTTATQTG